MSDIIETRNDEAGFIEFLNYDAPTIVREINGPCAILIDMNTRQTIGYRVYDPASKPVAGVEVKPLVWDEPSGHGVSPYYWAIGAKTPLKGYRIDWEGYGLDHTNHAGPFKLMDIGSYPTIEAAKAAAEADYRQRILSTLSLPAQEPVATFEVVELGKDGTRGVTHLMPELWWSKYPAGTHPLYASPQPEAVITEEVRKALTVYGEWAISVATLGELADLERKMSQVGITLQRMGELTAAMKEA